MSPLGIQHIVRLERFCDTIISAMSPTTFEDGVDFDDIARTDHWLAR